MTLFEINNSTYCGLCVNKVLLCILCFYLKQQSAKIIDTYIWEKYVWNKIQSSQWYKRRRISDRFCKYLLQPCFVNSCCMCISKYPSSEKRNKPTKYNVVIKIIIYLGVLDHTKFLIHYFRKLGFSLEIIFLLTIPQKIIIWNCPNTRLKGTIKNSKDCNNFNDKKIRREAYLFLQYYFFLEGEYKSWRRWLRLELCFEFIAKVHFSLLIFVIFNKHKIEEIWRTTTIYFYCFLGDGSTYLIEPLVFIYVLLLDYLQWYHCLFT